MALDAALASTLARLLAERFSTSESVLALHGRDESALPARPPDAVCFPETTAEVSRILAACNATGTPVIAFGVGTSLEGHVLPTRGGVTLDLSRMNRILALSPADLDVRVQAGVLKDQLNARLREEGLFFAVDPGADATIGGMAATGASGTMTARYGTIRENVLALQAVLADGTVVECGTRARKTSAGYDLVHLLCGSEGTLGVITELVVRCHGIPERIAAATVAFPSMAAAVAAATEIVQTGIPIARCEFVDGPAIAAVNRHADLAEAEQPTLFCEFHGTEQAVADQLDRAGLIAGEHGGAGFRFATREEDRLRLWAARHNAYFALLALQPGFRVVSTDACVPVSRLAECVELTAADAATTGLEIVLFGHVADGNFHTGVLVDPDSADDRAAADGFTSRLALRTIEMDGTVSGEHGIGLNKRGYLVRQYGAAAVDLMRTVKDALDPNGILNPDKVLPPRLEALDAAP